MTEVTNKQRYSGIDIIRIISMVMITSIHFICYSHVNSSINDIPHFNKVFIHVLQVFNKDFINLFVLITGFLLCGRSNTSGKIIPLWLNIFVTCQFVSIVLVPIGIELLNWDNVIHSLFPILSGNYWYFVTYFLLMLLTPFINELTSSWDINKYRNIIIFGGLIITIIIGANPFLNTPKFIGPQYSLVWFSYLYIFGGYIKRFGFGPKKLWCIIFFLTTLLGYWLIEKNITVLGKDQMQEYNILPFVSSLSIFVILYDVKIKKYWVNKLIEYIGLSSVYVYIIQENPFCREIFWGWINVDGYLFTPAIFIRWLLALITIFACSCFLNQLYKFLHVSFLYRIEEKIGDVLKTIANK